MDEFRFAPYDRALTIFSPEGRLLQVEYAKQAAKSGSTAIGIIATDGVAIIADKKIPNKLVISESVEKILKVDDHIIATFAGFIPDGKVLIDSAREIAQQHKLAYGTDIDLELLVKEIGITMELYTRYSGVRPFGVSIMFAGIDKGKTPKLYALDPSGLYYQYKAYVIGEGEDKILPILEEKYSNMKLNEAIRFGIELLKDFLKNNFSYERLIIGYIDINGKNEIITNTEIKRFYEEQQ